MPNNRHPDVLNSDHRDASEEKIETFVIEVLHLLIPVVATDSLSPREIFRIKSILARRGLAIVEIP